MKPARHRSIGLLAVAAACAPYGPAEVTLTGDESFTGCSLPSTDIARAAAPDGITALVNPKLVRPDHAEASYLADDDRVVGIRIGFDEVAIPLNILWWHEVVNLDLTGRQVVITHCPLTGSSLAFDRAPLGGVEFGVSGLLFRNNLMLYDRTRDQSLWPQMMRGARCGPRDGTPLVTVPVIESRWAEWKARYPDGRVLSDDTGFLHASYRISPYGDYDHNDDIYFPVTPDARRPLKERVLGLPDGGGAIAFPFGELDRLGSRAVARHASLDYGDVVVFWDRDARAAMAFVPEASGAQLTFSEQGGRIVDDQTGSAWRVDGSAISGPMAGSRLPPVSDAYVAFWFGWAAFHPSTAVWEAS